VKKFDEWIITEAEGSSNKTKAMTTVVDALREAFGKFDLPTRKKVWEELTSSKGKELVDKLVRNPKTYLSDSEFIKLIQKGKK
jgi:hypothetical protein